MCGDPHSGAEEGGEASWNGRNCGEVPGIAPRVPTYDAQMGHSMLKVWADICG